MKKIIVYTDGASRGNPGKTGIGVVDSKGHRSLFYWGRAE